VYIAHAWTKSTALLNKGLDKNSWLHRRWENRNL